MTWGFSRDTECTIHRMESWMWSTARGPCHPKKEKYFPEDCSSKTDPLTMESTVWLTSTLCPYACNCLIFKDQKISWPNSSFCSFMVTLVMPPFWDICFICIGVLCARVYVYCMHTVLMEARIAPRFLGTGVKDCCELAGRNREPSHLGPLKGQPVLLMGESHPLTVSI